MKQTVEKMLKTKDISDNAQFVLTSLTEIYWDNDKSKFSSYEIYHDKW